MRVVVVGSGIAGLTAAIAAAENGDSVKLFTKSDLLDSASYRAQGGIVSRGKKDSAKLLKADILAVADGMSKLSAVDQFVRQSPELLKSFLIDKIGVPFQKKNGKMDFASEAAHSTQRILYFGDNTGSIIIHALLDYLRKKTKVRIYTHHVVVDLINLPHHSVDPLSVYEPSRTVGIYVFDGKKEQQVVKSVFADKIILATGGIGQIYQQNTNPLGATGDGIAVAARAGARVINMEFTQFHPTAFHPTASTMAPIKEKFLISEALRGEGAVIVNENGEEFLKKIHPLGSLAPRDIVSRAIVQEQLKTRGGNIYLRLQCREGFEMEKRFPNIYKKCLEYNIDPKKQGIPITPAFHFSCGGVFCDINGRTSLPNLFVAGECACTGIHGANRLASTSLLEGLFLGYRCAKASLPQMPKLNEKKVLAWQPSPRAKKVDEIIIVQEFSALRLLMWNYVGVIRTEKNLSRALKQIVEMRSRIESIYRESQLTKSLLELRNAAHLAFLVADSAIKNKTSLGCHFRTN